MSQNRETELFIDHPSLKSDEDRILKAVARVLAALEDSFPSGDLSIAILSDAKIAEIHGDYLNDPTMTDVITFPGDVELGFAGEICVSADRALATHKDQGTTFPEELTLYIVHGLLHLYGLNDKTKEQTKEMRKGEERMMGLLQRDNLIPNFEITS